jgi:MEDS: MEthanogen/methylotroph, DcmR Sensory domain
MINVVEVSRRWLHSGKRAKTSDLGVDNLGHRVLVYHLEAQMIAAGGGLLSEVLGAGGAAVVLATPAHLTAIEAWLRLSGRDLEAAAAERRYRRLAIEEDSAWFESLADQASTFDVRLTEVVDQIPRDAAPVLVFGEVAATFWEKGQLDTALSLEAASHAISARGPVSVVCAYPKSVLATSADRESVCREHMAVLDAPAFPGSSQKMNGAVVSSVVLPPAPAACRAARELVRATLAPNGGAKACYTAELVVSELAANAVRHAGSTFTAEVLSSPGVVRVAVTDAAPLPSGWSGFPVETGHGLGVVTATAGNWAVEPLAGGKTVWADVARAQSRG